jgi:hypothetical protein
MRQLGGSGDGKGILRRALAVATLVGACNCISGCAANVVHSLETTRSTGIRYYESAPYLLVYSNGKGGLVWQIMALPDQSHVMQASPQVLAGRVQMALKFQNGVLISATSVGDSSVVPKAIIAAVQSALPLIVRSALEGPSNKSFPAPSLYKIIVKGDQIIFVGGKGDQDIAVPLNRGVGS